MNWIGTCVNANKSLHQTRLRSQVNFALFIGISCGTLLPGSLFPGQGQALQHSNCWDGFLSGWMTTNAFYIYQKAGQCSVWIITLIVDYFADKNLICCRTRDKDRRFSTAIVGMFFLGGPSVSI